MVHRDDDNNQNLCHMLLEAFPRKSPGVDQSSDIPMEDKLVVFEGDDIASIVGNLLDLEVDILELLPVEDDKMLMFEEGNLCNQKPLVIDTQKEELVYNQNPRFEVL